MHPMLPRAIEAAKSDNLDSARQLLIQILEQDPDDDRAWLWLSQVVATDTERAFCLDQVLRIDPANTLAARGLAVLGVPERAAAPEDALPEAEASAVLGDPATTPLDPAPAAPSASPADDKPEWKPAIVRRPPGEEELAGEPPAGTPRERLKERSRAPVPLPIAVANGIVIAVIIATLLIFRERVAAALSALLSVILMSPLATPQPGVVPGFVSGQAVLSGLEAGGSGYYRLSLPADALPPPLGAEASGSEPVSWTAQSATNPGGLVAFYDAALEAIVPVLLIDSQGLPQRGLRVHYRSSSGVSSILIEGVTGALVPRLVVIDHPTLLQPDGGTAERSRTPGLSRIARSLTGEAPVLDAVVVVLIPLIPGTSQRESEQTGLDLLDLDALARTAGGWHLDCLTSGQILTRTSTLVDLLILSLPAPEGAGQPGRIGISGGQRIGLPPAGGSLLDEPGRPLLFRRYLLPLPITQTLGAWASHLTGQDLAAIEMAGIAGDCAPVPDLRGTTLGEARQVLGVLGLEWLEFGDDGYPIPVTATQVLSLSVVSQFPQPAGDLAAPAEPAIPAMLPVGGAEGFDPLRLVVQLGASAGPPAAGPCEIVALADATVYMRPSLQATHFGTLPAGEQVPALARTPNGKWLGFDPGVAQAGKSGVFRLRWVQKAKGTQLQGDCSGLVEMPGPPPNVCFTLSLGDQAVYAEPAAASEVRLRLAEGEYAEVLALTEDGWAWVDLSRGNPTMDLQGWIQGLNLDGPCDQLNFIPHP